MLNLDGFKIGIGICYDIRFEELARIYRNNGNKTIKCLLMFKTKEKKTSAMIIRIIK